MNYILSNPKLFLFSPDLPTFKRQQGFQEGAGDRFPPRSDQKPSTLGHSPSCRQRERHSTTGGPLPGAGQTPQALNGHQAQPAAPLSTLSPPPVLEKLPVAKHWPGSSSAPTPTAVAELHSLLWSVSHPNILVPPPTPFGRSCLSQQEESNELALLSELWDSSSTFFSACKTKASGNFVILKVVGGEEGSALA